MKAFEQRKLEGDLRALGLAEPVRFIPHIPTMDEVRLNFASKYVIDHTSPTLWLFHNDNGDLRCKVQIKADKSVTGSCGSYKRNREGSCPHIGEYCILNGLEIPGGGFNTARRLDPAFVVHPHGKTHSTRRNKAYRDMGARIRSRAFALAEPLEGTLPPWPSLTKASKQKRRHKSGRPAIPLRVIVYAAIVKSVFDLSYYELQDVLSTDPLFARFGWHGTPNWNSMCDALAHPHVYSLMTEILGTTSRPGRNIDFIVALDATGMGTTKLQRWLSIKDEERHAESEASGSRGDDIDEVAGSRRKRKTPFIKVHTLMGLVSGLVYAIDTTLQFGEGTADVKHFKPLVERASLNCNFTAIAADKGYFSASHYAFCSRRDWLLFMWKKKGVEVENAGEGRDLLGYLDWLKREQYHVFARFYRLRPLIEAVFSCQKRQTGHIRLRLRTWEHARLKAMIYPHEIADSAPQIFHDGRDELCRMISMERVGYAQRTEALLKAIGANLRALVRLENEYDDRIDLNSDKAFKPMRRITLPKSA